VTTSTNQFQLKAKTSAQLLAHEAKQALPN